MIHNPNEETTMSLINTHVKPFKATAYANGKFIDVSDESLKGKWSVLMLSLIHISEPTRPY